MSQVADPTLLTLLEALNHLLHRRCDRLGTTVQDTGVGITLDCDPAIGNAHRLSGVVQPVQTDNVIARLAKVVESVPRTLRKDGHRDGLQAHLLQALGQVGGDVTEVRERVRGERGGGELAGPRVKDLDQLGTGGNLKRQILNTDLGNLLQQSLRLLRVLVNPGLGVDEKLATTALNHVAQQGPWRTTETNKRDTALQLKTGERNSLVHVVQLGLHVHILCHDLLVLSVRGRLQRLGEVRALLIQHLHDHSHSLGDDQDIREDNGGIDEAIISINGLEGQGRGDLRRAATFEEVTTTLGFMVLGKVATGCFVAVRTTNMI